MRKVWLSCLGVLVLLVSFAASANAGSKKFRKVPGTKGKALQMRTVAYNGSTNGRMVIEVRNRSKSEQKFEAAGLYFVPGGDPEKAPQRLGAAGPFELVTDKSGKESTGEAVANISIAPGATVKLEVHVFCIDSHRSSPSSSTPFKVAAKRMPKKLRSKIQTGTDKIMKRHKNRVAPKAASDIQSHVWETRDADWVELQGERKGEAKMKSQQRQQREAPQRIRHKHPRRK